MTSENLPALIQQPDDRASALATAFAQAAKTSHTSAARLRDLLGHNRSPGWLPWCVEQGIDPLGVVRPAHVLAWVADLAAAGDAESTRNRRLSTLSAFYRYLVREDTVPVNPVERLDPGEKPKSAKKIHRTSPTSVPSEEESDAIQEAADQLGAYQSAVIALLANTGARVGELIGATVDDIGSDRGHPVLSLPGKGGTRRLVPLSPPVWSRVQRMLGERTTHDDRLPTLTVGAKPKRPLLVRPDGNPEDRHGVARIVARVARRAGVGRLRLTPHGLRGAYATTLLAEGVPIYDVQRSMGHASTETTDRYNRGDLDLDRHPAYRMAEILARARQRRHARAGHQHPSGQEQSEK